MQLFTVACVLSLSILGIDVRHQGVSASPIASGYALEHFAPTQPPSPYSGPPIGGQILPRQDTPPVHLAPIREDTFIHPSLRRRTNSSIVDDFSPLKCGPEARMFYGAPDEDAASLYVANMTLYAPDGEEIVMMEKFDHLTRSIDCHGDDGRMSLTFKSEAAMKYAMEVWAWVNEDSQKSFILIANHKSCGPEDQRYPYRITAVKNEPGQLKTILTASRQSWNAIASDFDIDFGKAPVALKSVTNKRGFIHDLTDKIENKLNDALTIDKEKTVTWNLTTDTRGYRQLFKDPMHEFPTYIVDCNDCYLSGSISFTGRVAIKAFKIVELNFEANPNDLKARLALNIYLYAPTLVPIMPALEVQLLTLGIPGLAIPDLFTIGPSLNYEVGFWTGIYGWANFSMGMEATIPNSASVKLDLVDHDHMSATGWEDTKVDSTGFNLNEVAVTLEANVYAQPQIAFGINILDKMFEYDAALTLKLPIINANLTAIYSDEGVCSHEVGASKTALITKAAAAIELWFNVGPTKQTPEDSASLGAVVVANVGASGVAKLAGAIGVTGSKLKRDLKSFLLPTFDRKIFGLKYPFWNICYPVHIPSLFPDVGMNKTTTKTTLPTAAATVSAFGVEQTSEAATQSIPLGPQTPMPPPQSTQTLAPGTGGDSVPFPGGPAAWRA